MGLGNAYSVILPAGVTRAIRSEMLSTTPRLPSGPATMPPGLLTGANGASGMWPARVMLPTASPLYSPNQIAPSGPRVSAVAGLERPAYSVMWPIGGNAPNSGRVPFCEPQRAIRTSEQGRGAACGWGECELRQLAMRGQPANLAIVEGGKPHVVIWSAGIYGERPRSAKEVALATQRALEQRALERWRLQKDAEIEGMMRRGEPLGAVAAALASPETAERIAVLEAATSGRMSSLLAARLNVARAGGDLSVLDGLHHHQQGERTRSQLVELDAGRENGARPLVEARRN